MCQTSCTNPVACNTVSAIVQDKMTNEDELKVDFTQIHQRKRRQPRCNCNFFAFYGRLVGQYPWTCLLFTFLFLWPVIGVFWMNVKDNIRDGYTPKNAPSRHEVEVLREFYNTTGEPLMTAVILTPKDNGSILRLPHLQEAADMARHLLHTFEVRLEDDVPFYYYELCEPYCNINKPLELFNQGLTSEWNTVSQGYPPNHATQLTYPVASINGYKIPLQRLFYGVKRKEMNTTDLSVIDPSVRLTNMESVDIIMLLFRGDIDSELAERRLTAWEMAVWRYVYEQYNSTLLNVEAIGLKILDQEMIKDGKRMTPFFAAGFTIVGIFVAFAILVPSAMQKSLDSSKLWIVGVALGCPLLAITAAFGAMTLLHMRVNSFLLIMPTLVLGIGVDDGFLLIHSWLRHHHLNPRIRIAAVLVDVGPSMTITTVTNVLSFGIGCLTPTPEIQLFCFGTMLALAIVYSFHLFLFCPVLVITDQWSNKTEKADSEELALYEKLPIAESPFIRKFTNILGQPWFVFGTLSLMVFYWVIFGYNMLQIEPRLDAAKILPRSSRIQRPNEILHDFIWREYQAVNVIVNRPFQIDSADDRKWLMELVEEFERLPRCLGPEFTMMWFRDYEEFFYQGADLFDVIFGDVEPEDVSSGTGTGELKPLDASKLTKFLRSPFYKHWRGFLRVAPDNRTITKFWFSVGYTNVTGWGDRIEFVQKWREIAARFPQLNVTTWEPSGNAMFVDQMLGLKQVAMQTTLLTWTCMAVVCGIFIRNFGTVVVASASIFSICLGVIGALSLLGFDLDPVTVCALLMSIGLSVDYTAHTTSHFQRHRKTSRNTLECINQSLDAIAWPMIQSAVSTVLCVLPLIFSFAYTTRVFFVTICLVTVIGLLHGLVIVPCFFMFIGYVRGERVSQEKVPLSIEDVIEETKTRIMEETNAQEAIGNKSETIEIIDESTSNVQTSTGSRSDDDNQMLIRRGVRQFQVLPHRHSDNPL
ncbi:SSD domain-containing protein [Aphelenchoides besseyi]|nr:SSD domain-containing protein [Aphelenchoides besseyi]